MNFPALDDLPLDPLIAENPTAIRVYLRLKTILTFHEPRAVKAWVLADELRIRPQTAAKQITLLTKRGFLHCHGRTMNNVGLYTLVWSRNASLALERTTTAA